MEVLKEMEVLAVQSLLDRDKQKKDSIQFVLTPKS